MPCSLQAIEIPLVNDILGNEITNGVDLLCAMISSAVTTNYRTGLEAAHLFIPLIRNEKILLTNLVKVLADKVHSSRNNVIPLLDQSKSQMSAMTWKPHDIAHMIWFHVI